MKSSTPIILLVIFFVSLAGCASQSTSDKNDAANILTSVGIQYLSNGTDYRKSNLTYKLLPINGSEFDLKLIKTGNEIKRILRTAGMEESSNPDVIVYFDFGSGEIKPIEHSIPYAIRGQTGVASTTTTGTIYGSNISLSTRVNPTYGVIGYGEHKYTTYIDSYHLSLLAIDVSSLKKGEPKQLWMAVAASSGKLFNESLSLKAMLMNIKDFIGRGNDVSFSVHMKKEEITNPSHEMQLEVDQVTERSNLYLKQINDSYEINQPQPYSQSNQNQQAIKKIGNWVVFCQRKDGKTNGCGMTDNGITIFIEEKSHAATILVGGHEFLASGSDVCLEVDNEITCLEVEDKKDDRSPPKYKVFRDALFWKLEKAKHVMVSYTFDQEKVINTNNIDMSHYSGALDTLRRSLP